MPRILHIGLGNFHRAHQAWYTARAGADWRITGVAMTNGDLVNAVAEQGGYTLGIRGIDGLRTEWIGVHDRLILAGGDSDDVLTAFVDPDLHIVTITVTEKGYCLTTEGSLDLAHPSISGDLAGAPRSAIGLLVHGIARRVAAELAPLTIISCDNISDNGRKLEAAVGAFVEVADLRLDPGNRFPNSMVDRITPATTAELAAEIINTSGLSDRVPVMTEAFAEWVIEDSFASLRPDWEQVGAEIVQEVAPYEWRKLRLLNAAHSYLAYAGQLAGYSYVHEAMDDQTLREGVERLWDEGAATLPVAVQSTVPAYREALAERFTVAGMRHSLAQIAMDGSLKLRERLVPVIRALDDAPQTTKVIAAWIAFVRNAVIEGKKIQDPNAGQLRDLVMRGGDMNVLCEAMVGVIGIESANADWLEDLVEQVERISL